MTTGKFIQQGTKLGTMYAERADQMSMLIDDFYKMQFGQFQKSAGAATYGDNGYFNAVMGKEIMAAMFASDTVFTMLGARPYNHEGVRIATELADYGLDSEGREFLGIGAGTIQDGLIPKSVKMPVKEYRQPYKELPFSFDYGKSLRALEAKEDDMITYNDYVDKMSKNYTDLIDKTLLRPIWKSQPKVDGIETSLTGIARAIGSVEDMNVSYDVPGGTYAPIDDDVCPYGGINGDFTARINRGTPADPNLSGQLIDAEKSVLDIDMMSELYTRCSINWTDFGSPNNKAFLISNIARRKLESLFLSQNIILDQVYVQRGFNGVKTMPGRGVGLVAHAYNNVPLITSGNINFDYSKKQVSTTSIGDITLLDLDHLWMSILTPVEMYTVDNPAITRVLQEQNVLNMRAELRIDSFIQHGRIVNLSSGSATAAP